MRVANLSTIWTVLYTQPVSLQLDAAILSARRGAGAELGGDRAASSSASTTPTPTSTPSPTGSWPPRGPWSRTASGGRTPALTNKAIKRQRPARRCCADADSGGAQAMARAWAGSISSPAQQAQRRPVVEVMSWNGSVRILVNHTRPVCTSRMKNRWTVRNSSAPPARTEPELRQVRRGSSSGRCYGCEEPEQRRREVERRAASAPRCVCRITLRRRL